MYNTAENDVQFYMIEIDKSRKLYSREGDNSRRLAWERTIPATNNV